MPAPITAAEISVIDQLMARSARQLTAILDSYRRTAPGDSGDIQALARIALALDIGLSRDDVTGIALAAIRKIIQLEKQVP